MRSQHLTRLGTKAKNKDLETQTQPDLKYNVFDSTLDSNRTTYQFSVIKLTSKTASIFNEFKYCFKNTYFMF